jgi:hypothetical protein
MPGSGHQSRGILVPLGAAIATTVLLAGCTSSSSHHSHVLTRAEGLHICNDVKTWMEAAENQNRPRFTPLLERDERDAANTALGAHLGKLDKELHTENSDAFIPGTPQQPTDFQDIQHNCADYGVKVPGVDI